MPLSRIQPHRYDALLAEKSAAVTAMLTPFEAPSPVVYPSVPTGFRMRAEFRVWHSGDALDYVMFRPGDPRTPVPVADFPIACEAIQALMPPLRDWLQGDTELRRKLFQVEFLSTLAGDTLLTLAYHRPLDEAWEAAAGLVADAFDVAIVGRSRGQKLVVRRDYVEERLAIHGRDYHYRQYEQSFTQPNAAVNRAMIEWALDRAEGLSGDLLELYCGNGNFTLPLADRFADVIATEVSKASVRAALENARANAIDNVQLIRLSAEETAAAMAGEREFRRLQSLRRPLPDYALNTLFVDPPRAGLDAATLQLAGRFDNILYISCNPVSLASHLEALTRSHGITAFAQFDQFPYTDHMECGVLLQRKSCHQGL